ncbi:MAG: P1 family peptidase, partial [Anaerolineaceae bacterium]
MKTIRQSITTVPGVRLGHAQNDVAVTGCSVILLPPDTICGVDQRGGAPGTRETDLLHPMHMVQEAHAILLTGGSAFGLDAAGGVMRFLEENKSGINTLVARVPIVPAAVIFDLDIGESSIRPDSLMGYQACLNAENLDGADIADRGNVGAGTGAKVGSFLGIRSAMKSGLGSAAIEVRPGLFVAAIFVVNAFGDVVDRQTGQIIAGARSVNFSGIKIGSNGYFADTLETMRTMLGSQVMKFIRAQNTVIGAVVTNAKLDKEEINKVAQMAHNGIAQVIRPAHTMLDGDTIFAAATNKKRADVNLIGAYAAEATALAILDAVRSAQPAAGLPSASSVNQPSSGGKHA